MEIDGKRKTAGAKKGRKTQSFPAKVRFGRISLRERMGIEPTWRLCRRHTRFEARGGPQSRVHSPGVGVTLIVQSGLRGSTVEHRESTSREVRGFRVRLLVGGKLTEAPAHDIKLRLC